MNGLADRHGDRVVLLPKNSNDPSSCGADEFATLSTTIRLSAEFSTVGIPLETCGYTTESTILNFVNDKWAASDTGKAARKILLKLYKRRTAILLRL